MVRHACHVVQVSFDDALFDACDSEPLTRQLHYARRLDERAAGSSVSIIAFCRQKRSCAIERENLRVIPIPGGWLAAFRLFICLAILDRRRRVDVITTQTLGWEAMVALVFAWFRRCRVIGQIHYDIFSDVAHRQARWGHLRFMIARFVAGRLFAVRAVSESTAAELRRRGWHSNVHAIPVPVTQIGSQAVSDTVHDSRVLYVGRLDREKGLERWLHVAARVLARYPRAEFHLVGDGGQRAELECLARTLGIATHVKFHGRIPNQDIERIYRTANVFLLTSHYEGLSRAAVEASRCGLPIVGVAITGIADVVYQNVSGYLHAGDDLEGLADSVVRLLSDPLKARRMGEAGRREVLRRFDPAQLISKWVDLWISGVQAYQLDSRPVSQTRAVASSPRSVLVVNFEMNPESPVLAWQHDVVRRLAKYYPHVVVVTQSAANLALPDNVTVWTIPRWWARAPQRWVGSKWLANILVYRLCKQFDVQACFVHMSMEWAYRLFPIFRHFGVPVLLWYAHRAVTLRLHLAHRCSDRVITSTPSAFRINSRKVRVIGQGIDTHRLVPDPTVSRKDWVVAIGRITPCKRLHLMIEAIVWLKEHSPQTNIKLRLFGAPATRADRAYAERLRDLARLRNVSDRVDFAGHISPGALVPIYRRARASLNLCVTGALDKVVLEALACGCPVLTTNAAFGEAFRRHDLSHLLLEDDTPKAIGERLKWIWHNTAALPVEQLRAVALPHDLDAYVRCVVTELDALCGAKAAMKRGNIMDSVGGRDVVG